MKISLVGGPRFAFKLAREVLDEDAADERRIEFSKLAMVRE